MRARNSIGLRAFLVALSIAFPAHVFAAPQGIQDKKAEAYARAKQQMPPDLYLVYRIAERVAIANGLNRPIRVAVRKNIDCAGSLGLDPVGLKCQSLQLLPEVDKASNFDIWAAQVVGTLNGNPNAFAFSNSGALFLNIAMLKELTGKVDQAACVIAHEMAHITQNHAEQKDGKIKELDLKAGEKIGSAVNNAHSAQQSARTMALLFGGIAAGLSGDRSSLQQTQMNIAIANFSAQAIAPQIAQKALEYTPSVGDSFGKMQGLSPAYVQRTLQDVNNYLRDFTLALAGFSRQLEYEADLLGAEYVATAGFNAQECQKLWTETMPHTQDQLIERLLPEGVKDPGVNVAQGEGGEHDGLTMEEIARKAFEESVAQSKKIKDIANTKGSKKIESDEVPKEVMDQLASSHPDGMSRASAIKNHLAKRSRLSDLKSQGSARLSTIFIRNWSYDEQSDSVIISSEMVRPEQAGLKANGTTGIDIDQELGF